VGYNPERIRFVKGRVEETVPDQAPPALALLRLDTDWYESTRHELVHMFPLLSKGGIIIIDDYGHWQGARRATDEYLSENTIPLFLHRIDYTGRMGVKL
jgi:O-methyltransferase